MIETWEDLLGLLRQNGVPGTTLSHDTLRMLDAITDAASKPPPPEPHRTVRNATESRLRELGIMSSVTSAATQPHRTVRDVVESRLQTLGVVLPVSVDDLVLGEVAFFWRDFFPYETLECEGRVLAVVHDATRTVPIGGIEYPVIWNSNQPTVTLPREIRQAPPEAAIPLWLRQGGGEIHFGKQGKGCLKYERTPGPDEALERAVASLQQPRWRDLAHDWRLLAQPVAWLNAAGDRETRWCVPVAPLTGTVPTDDFAVCGAQHAAVRAARRLLATGLARQARTAPEQELSARILDIMPVWEELTDYIVSSLPIKAAESAHNPA